MLETNLKVNKELLSLVSKFKKALPEYQQPINKLSLQHTVYPSGIVINYKEVESSNLVRNRLWNN